MPARERPMRLAVMAAEQSIRERTEGNAYPESTKKDGIIPASTNHRVSKYKALQCKAALGEEKWRVKMTGFHRQRLPKGAPAVGTYPVGKTSAMYWPSAFFRIAFGLGCPLADKESE